MKRWIASSEKRTSIGSSVGAGAVGQAVPGGGDEEVEQVVLAARRVHEHEAARARAGERRLGHERHEHRGDGGVDGVAAGAQDVGGRLGGHGVSGCDDSSHGGEPRASA